MIKIAVAGLGKMGLSHLAMINVHPEVQVSAICDSAGYVLDILHKYTGVQVFSNYETMLAEADLDAVIIATPSFLHENMVRTALERGLHVFCEKPFTLSANDSAALTEIAKEKNLVNQVGYHCRFIGVFQEVKKLLDAGVIGEISNISAEAYGPVVLRPKGSTWRTRRVAGGGCLYDYAAHPINLVNWYLGAPIAAGGSALNSIFSPETDDEVLSTLFFENGKTAQICVNWSDESYRKMTTKLTIFGSNGKIVADRQELQLFLRDSKSAPAGYNTGWNTRYTTDLTGEVWYYVRGEEYSAQLDHFVRCIADSSKSNLNSFAEALKTDQAIEMIVENARSKIDTVATSQRPGRATKGFASWFRK